jgi:colicin import membrane protein
MKKLFLFCIGLAWSTAAFTQEITLKKSGNLQVKTETSVGTPKAKVSEMDKRTKREKDEFKRRKREGLGYAKGKEGKAKAEINKADAKIKEEGKGITKRVKETASTEKAPKVADKVTGNYNGKKVYTGVKGGKYYINSNGNKTYIHD